MGCSFSSPALAGGAIWEVAQNGALAAAFLGGVGSFYINDGFGGNGNAQCFPKAKASATPYVLQYDTNLVPTSTITCNSVPVSTPFTVRCPVKRTDMTDGTYAFSFDFPEGTYTGADGSTTVNPTDLGFSTFTIGTTTTISTTTTDGATCDATSPTITPTITTHALEVTAVPTPHPEFRCKQEGHLRRMKRRQMSTISQSLESCAQYCVNDPGCVSFSFTTRTKLCQRYNRALGQMQFEPSNSGVIYYSRYCYNFKEAFAGPDSTTFPQPSTTEYACTTSPPSKK